MCDTRPHQPHGVVIVAVSPIAVRGGEGVGGNLDQDDLDAIGSISAARGVTRQVNENARSPADMIGKLTLDRTSSSATELGDMRAARLGPRGRPTSGSA